jgi:hypothetical protein
MKSSGILPMARSRKCTSSNQDGKTKTQKLGRGGKKKEKPPILVSREIK